MNPGQDQRIIKGTDESITRVDSSVPLMHHNLGSLTHLDQRELGDKDEWTFLSPPMGPSTSQRLNSS